MKARVELEADAILLSTGSRPRVPDWAAIDGERVLTTRQAYPPPEIPEHLVVIGSGVTGVEFTHMFSALGSQVSLIVSRQQVLPAKDPEVAAVLEAEFMRRGVKLLKGARATAIGREDDKVFIACDDGRAVDGSHALLCIGSVPNTEGLGCEIAGVEVDDRGFVPGNRHCQTNLPHIYSAGDVSGRLPLSSVAAMQGRKIAEHVMGLTARAHRHLDYDKASQAIFTDPEIAEVGVAEAEAFAAGRKLRVTKVPFSANPKALINGDTRGFREDPQRPGDGCGARRGDRRSQRRGVDLGDRGGGDEPVEGRRHRRLVARAPGVGRVTRRCRLLMVAVRQLGVDDAPARTELDRALHRLPEH